VAALDTSSGAILLPRDRPRARVRATGVSVAFALATPLLAAPPRFEARFVLPPQDQHVHSSSIVEMPGGDLFAVWYRGSGERRAVQAADGLVHVSHSHADPAPGGGTRREAVKHVAFDPARVAVAERLSPEGGQ
jgi:hypothetical protein